MSIPLEDTFADILNKAQSGLALADSQLAAQSGVSLAELKSLRGGKFDEPTLRKVAPALQLNTEALAQIARNQWKPKPVEVDGLLAVNTPFGDMTVNAYLVWDRASKEAAIFDTGADCSRFLRFIQNNRLAPNYILLTHTHGDHIFDLDRLQEKTGAPAFVSEREPLSGAESFREGKSFALGSLRIETRLTWGHSPGGTTYLIHGLAKPVAIVGDALFAGSMGGGKLSYADALGTNRAQILSLPEETVICPGHGPMTTVGEEKRHNPFFAL
jgi:glyoxylase-like metal-dependent hydrolase (beta-lactamase superfamily II)